VVVAAFTAVSRASGLVRVLVVGAVLGPTPLGNTYQVSNSLPNLVWYGFLAGSLVASVLVPLLVTWLDKGDRSRVEAVSSGFLGLVCVGALVLAPVAVLLLPLLLQLATLGVPVEVSHRQVELARVLVLLTIPQVFLYAVVGTAGAVMNSQRRFGLAAVGPAVENLGVIAVLAATAVGFGSGEGAGTSPIGEIVLLGAGSTVAVGVNAALQWWGARRCGVTLRPSAGWRDPQLLLVLRRARQSITAAGLLAAQTFLVVLVASRVAGGAVALQISLNFYALPLALVATPVGLALLPELSRDAHEPARFWAVFGHALSSAVFLAAPAAAGYVVLAPALIEAVAPPQMTQPVVEEMLRGSLVALSCGLVGQVVCFITTQAAFARGRTVAVPRCMALQTLVCVALCGVSALLLDGPQLVVAVAASYAVAAVLGGALLLVVVRRPPRVLLATSALDCARLACGVVGMAAVLLLVHRSMPGEGRVHALVEVGVGGLVGLVTYLVVEHALDAPELRWWAAGLTRRPKERGLAKEGP
jgi:putative peptidoglycan lipid II flippase